MAHQIRNTGLPESIQSRRRYEFAPPERAEENKPTGCLTMVLGFLLIISAIVIIVIIAN